MVSGCFTAALNARRPIKGKSLQKERPSGSRNHITRYASGVEQSLKRLKVSRSIAVKSAFMKQTRNNIGMNGRKHIFPGCSGVKSVVLSLLQSVVPRALFFVAIYAQTYI